MTRASSEFSQEGGRALTARGVISIRSGLGMMRVRTMELVCVDVCVLRVLWGAARHRRSGAWGWPDDVAVEMRMDAVDGMSV